MPNDSLSQQALANDATFRRRVKAILAQVAFEVLNEDPLTAGHTARASYARTVINNLDAAAANVSGWLVMRTNVFSFATSVSLTTGTPIVLTASGDPDIASQLATDWNILAGV